MKELVFISAAQSVGKVFTIKGSTQISSVQAELNGFMQYKKGILFNSGAEDAEATASYLRKNPVEGIGCYRGMKFLNHSGKSDFYREMQEALSSIRPAETDAVIMVVQQILIDKYVAGKVKEFKGNTATGAATIIVMDAGTDDWDKTSRKTWELAAVKSVIFPK